MSAPGNELHFYGMVVRRIDGNFYEVCSQSHKFGEEQVVQVHATHVEGYFRALVEAGVNGLQRRPIARPQEDAAARASLIGIHPMARL